MKNAGIFLALLVVVSTLATVRAEPPPIPDRTKGYKCLACTVLVGMVEQITMDTKMSIPDAGSKLCYELGQHYTLVKWACELYSKKYFAMIEEDFKNGVTPDETCRGKLGYCIDYPTCSAFKKWPPASFDSQPQHQLSSSFSHRHMPSAYLEHFAKTRGLRSANPKFSSPSASPSGLLAEHHAAFDAVLKLLGINAQPTPSASFYPESPFTPLYRVESSIPHLPSWDLDGDRYSTSASLRGYHWRGKDCNDWNNAIYPGRKDTSYDSSTDHNCNGIKGDDADGQSFEHKFCETVPNGYRGIISLGDSVTAHFRIPPSWLNVTYIENDDNPYDNMVSLAEDEMDWPHCSWSTGFDPNYRDNCPPSDLPLNSLYLKFRQRNPCNHRDYQNVGVNGADTWTTKPPNGNIMGIHSRIDHDYPVTLFYGLLGNDLCWPQHSFDPLTKPTEFAQNILEGLQYLDTILPPSSHVVMLGPVDGRILYETLHDQLHPTGILYSDFYDYLNCLEVSSCWGWMNSNSTVRDITAGIANDMSANLKQMQQTHKFKNFQTSYTRIDYQQVSALWHNAKDLIEPSDGFHPTQTANALIADVLFKHLEEEAPNALPAVNPHTDDILRVFGNQGGYENN